MAHQIADGDIGALREKMSQLRNMDSEERNLMRSYASQVNSLKRDLFLVTKQIETEQERKKNCELALSEETSAVTLDEAQAIARREHDIRAIKEEKAAMVEWLHRGVAEAKRISDQVGGLRTDLDASADKVSELQLDKRKLQDVETRLQHEIEDTNNRIKEFKDTIASMEEHCEHQAQLVRATNDIAQTTMQDSDRLSADFTTLQERARDMEKVDMAVSCLAACVRRAQADLESLNHDITHGEMPSDTVEYDSDGEADETVFTPVVISSTKNRIGRCDAQLVTLWSALKRFEGDQSIRTDSFKVRCAEEIYHFKHETEAMVKFHENQVAELRAENARREPQLRTFIALRDKALYESRDEILRAAQHGDALPPFNLIKYYENQNALEVAKRDRLRQSNAELEAKVQDREEDYAQIKELKREYRDLEAEKMLLVHQMRQAETENKQCRFTFQMKSSQPPASPKRKRGPWRSNVLS